MPNRLITPKGLPLNHRRVIGNRFIAVLQNKRNWKKHERIYNEPPNFKVIGAHANPNPKQNKDTVETWLSFIVHSDDRIGLPTYACLISGTVYQKARADLSREGLIHSLDYLLKARSSAPYRVDKDRNRYRVRRAQKYQTLTDSQEEAIMMLINYLALQDVADELLSRYYGDNTFNKVYEDLMSKVGK